MPLKRISPAELEGEALRRWYLRSPDEIQREREAAEEQRFQAFYVGAQTASENTVAGGSALPAQPLTANSDDVLWIANGRGGFRAIRPRASDFQATLEPDESPAYPDHIPESAAAFEDRDLQEVGNPHNPRLRGEWERANARLWPTTADGRNFDVAHTKAIADGGTNTLDNIQPTHPDEHRAQHRNNGDNARFGRRSSIARAFGGRVQPPAHAPRPSGGSTVRGLGILGLVPNITGILSGRVRTDTAVHFWNDMLGYSSEDDLPPKDLVV